MVFRGTAETAGLVDIVRIIGIGYAAHALATSFVLIFVFDLTAALVLADILAFRRKTIVTHEVGVRASGCFLAPTLAGHLIALPFAAALLLAAALTGLLILTHRVTLRNRLPERYRVASYFYAVV